MLRGRILEEDVAGERVLRGFSVADLPGEAGPRFAALFALRPRWLWPDLEPFLEGLQARVWAHCRAT